MEQKTLIKIGRLHIVEPVPSDGKMYWNMDSKKSFTEPSDYQECIFSDRQAIKFMLEAAEEEKGLDQIAHRVLMHNPLHREVGFLQSELDKLRK